MLNYFRRDAVECPKCKYVRVASDLGPEYECPKCGIVYSKFDPASEAKKELLRVRAANRSIFKSPSGYVGEENSKVCKNKFSIIQILKKNFIIFSEKITQNKAAKVTVYILSLWIFSFVIKSIFGDKFHGLIALVLIGGIFVWMVLQLIKKSNQKNGNSSYAESNSENLKITACRTCGETVAVTAKVCPHCGESKPAPKIKKPPTQVTEKHLIIAVIVFIIIIIAVMNPEKPITAEEVIARCARELGIDQESGSPISIGDIYALDGCLNKYGINTKAKR